VTLGMLLLMLGLIHVAPLGATQPTRVVVNQTVGRGFIRVHAFPWATISIDGKPAGETPIDKAIEVADGGHTIEFTHPWYAPVERTVEVNGGTPDGAQLIAVDFVKEKLPTLPGKVLPAGIGSKPADAKPPGGDKPAKPPGGDR
jgi:hypothetical protein